MTKVSIIAVDLGFNVDELINRDISELSADAKSILDVAIADKKKILETKQRLDAKKTQQDAKINRVMTEAYAKLESAGSSGVPVDDILVDVLGTIPNSSAFTLRMKTMLREKGNKWAIIRKKINKVACYCFIPFNTEKEDGQTEA